MRPALLVIAGPNGSGKTTITVRLRHEHWSEGVEGWREETLRVLGRLFRGATAFPPGRGVWRDDKTSELVFDDTVMVTC